MNRTSRLAAGLRRRLWRAAFALCGGLAVSGPVPRGPAVVVANHSSHADTAALLAALPAASPPRAAAAADYWFEVPWRRGIVSALVGALPVQRGRHGGYACLLDAARPHLAAGGVVVVYPEGTRSQDGEVAAFHSGAVRLARDTGVPLVAAGIVGTRELLPKHGVLSPVPVEVRFAPAVSAADVDAAALRRLVVEQVERGAAVCRPSPMWRGAARFAAGRALVVTAALWGFAEALSWPVIAEMFLVLAAVALPRRVLPAGVALAAGSVLGVVVHTWLAGRGVDLPAPLTTDAMRAAAARHLEAGPLGLLQQAVNGIPVKVYAAEAGKAGLHSLAVGAAAAIERPLRILTVAGVLALAARLLHPWLRRLYGTYLVLATAAFVVALARVLHSWSV